MFGRDLWVTGRAAAPGHAGSGWATGLGDRAEARCVERLRGLIVYVTALIVR